MLVVANAALTACGTRDLDEVERALDFYIIAAGGNPADDATWDLYPLDGGHSVIVAR
jgi:hypothetical protein